MVACGHEEDVDVRWGGLHHRFDGVYYVFYGAAGANADVAHGSGHEVLVDGGDGGSALCILDEFDFVV